jgi:hypothetical protein
VKNVIYLIVIIGWGILQARRKAMREQQRKQAAAAPSPVPARATQRQAVVLGPVSAEENRPIYIDRSTSADRSSYTDRSIPLPTPSINIYQDRSQPLIEETPEAIRPLMESAKRRKKKKQADEEVVEEIVPTTSSIGMQNYEKVDAVQTRFALDKDSLRKYVVIREVLGPPRSRKRHMPGVKNRE